MIVQQALLFFFDLKLKEIRVFGRGDRPDVAWLAGECELSTDRVNAAIHYLREIGWLYSRQPRAENARGEIRGRVAIRKLTFAFFAAFGVLRAINAWLHGKELAPIATTAPRPATSPRGPPEFAMPRPTPTWSD